MGEVKVFGSWVSPYSKRVEIALKIKGIEYEYIEESLKNKSKQLLRYNPIHKKVPVFIHDRNLIIESLVILEYIDETWKDNPLLPTDSNGRALARFWAKFIDDELIPTVRGALVSQGKEGAKLTQQAEELLKVFENEIKGKKFLGGNIIGFLDIVAIVVAYWIPTFQEAAGKDHLFTRDKYPSICAWADLLFSCSVIHQNLPRRDKMLKFYRALFASRSGNDRIAMRSKL